MTALDSVRRKRTTIMLAASLATLMLLGGFAYAGYKALRRYEGAKKVDNVRQTIPDAPVAMLATVDDSSVLTTVTLVVLRPGTAGGGTVVPLPVSLDTTSGFGDERLALTEMYATGGAEELKSGVENTVGITVDLWQVASPADAEALLSRLTEIPVDFPSPVGDQFPSGDALLSPAQAVQVLNFRADGEADRARRPNIEAVWKGVAEAISAAPLAPIDPTVTATSQGSADAPAPQSMTQVFDRLFAGSLNSRPIAASLTDPELNPEAKDVEQLDIGDAVLVLATIAPRSLATPAAGLSYMIQAPPGSEAQVLDAIRLLLYSGGNVKWVRFDGPIVEATTFFVSQDSIRQQVEASGSSANYQGVRFEELEMPIEDIDVVIQLALSQPTATSTAVTTGSTTASTVPATTGA